MYRPQTVAQPRIAPQPNGISAPPVYRPNIPVLPSPTGGPSRASTIQQNTFGQYVWLLNSRGKLSEKVKKRLREGQEAIQKTRRKLNAGVGNITQQVDRSSGISYVTTHYVKYIAGEYAKLGVGALESWAIAARRGSAGNCDEFAAVTYFHLLEMNTNDNVSVVGLPDVHHHFVLIGNVNDPENDEAVVVDPWPAKGFAVRYKEWEYNGERMQTTLGPTLSQGQTPLKSARATLKQSGYTRKAVYEGLKHAFDQYGSSAELKEKIEAEKAKVDGRYLWGNVNTVKKEDLAKLDAIFIKEASFNHVLMSDEELAGAFLT